MPLTSTEVVAELNTKSNPGAPPWTKPTSLQNLKNVVPIERVKDFVEFQFEKEGWEMHLSRDRDHLLDCYQTVQYATSSNEGWLNRVYKSVNLVSKV